ncbi:hypothetical protein GBAR_LOCUS15426 [Geodia barretti]|uniref:Uncharacterized protein n=1 Tax=Geodia barretti TaxID=519541 RepID=A0AA35WMI0_GEOBA|nr:hypothetical protein GBAR_LOCUS15426 [Geodia barretti]
MTISLTVATSGMRNGTNVTCITLVGNDVCNMTATIYVTDVPKSIKAVGRCKPREGHSSTRARRYV